MPGATRLQGLASRLLSRASTRADRIVSESLGTRGARKWHYAVLAALEEHGPASQATLSDRAGLYRSDLVAVLNELEEAEYVERTADPEDRRRNVITITRGGRSQLGRLDGLIGEAQDELLAPLAPAERKELVRLLRKVVETST
jgi:MarR family transcriptional regulator, lower aerobic nicotinate degradation pathway regulator